MSNCIHKLCVDKVSKSFESIKVLDDISITVGSKEFVSLLGVSGSGKSTIFNIISGLVMPDAGGVYIDGEEFTGKTGRVGYMHQKDLLLPWKKIIDNVALPLVLKGESLKAAREKAAHLFDIFSMQGAEYLYPFQLSGGMRQRAALMRTYVFSSDIMLLDEPFGSLDAITRSRMHQWLMDLLHKVDSSILLITHDIDEAVFLSDRIYVLSGSPSSVVKEMKVDFKRPRSIDITTSGEFNRIKREIINLLSQ